MHAAPAHYLNEQINLSDEISQIYSANRENLQKCELKSHEISGKWRIGNETVWLTDIYDTGLTHLNSISLLEVTIQVI